MPTRLGDTTGRVWLFDTHETPEREIYLLLQHVAGAFIQELAVLLRPAGITPEQYHVLRVLRDGGAGGLACSAVAERSVSGDPDVTRLLDRLEKQGWASRERDANDRRVVVARITRDGRRLLDELEEPVAALHARQLEGLTTRELPVLQKILKKLAGARPVA
jgi:DNA-binding MarR family transcriptional regulator